MAKVLTKSGIKDVSDNEIHGTPEQRAALVAKVYVAAVKAEAHRRIIAICPEWKQRNLTARMAILSGKDMTPAEADEWDAAEAIWSDINAIRAASDAIEVMDPRPADVTADELWA